jgi:hypothetical protein
MAEKGASESKIVERQRLNHVLDRFGQLGMRRFEARNGILQFGPHVLIRLD